MFSTSYGTTTHHPQTRLRAFQGRRAPQKRPFWSTNIRRSPPHLARNLQIRGLRCHRLRQRRHQPPPSPPKLPISCNRPPGTPLSESFQHRPSNGNDQKWLLSLQIRVISTKPTRRNQVIFSPPLLLHSPLPQGTHAQRCRQAQQARRS